RFSGATSPLPVYAAATALWNDDAHVEENRALHRRQLDIAEEMFGSHIGYYRPGGGVCLWLGVGRGVDAGRRLWTKGAVRVLPERYLSVAGPDGINPGDPYIRVALVAPPDESKEALTRLANSL